jgi:hypothetical protein
VTIFVERLTFFGISFLDGGLTELSHRKVSPEAGNAQPG